VCASDVMPHAQIQQLKSKDMKNYIKTTGKSLVGIKHLFFTSRKNIHNKDETY